MILNLIPLLVVAVAGYYIFIKFIAGKLDCPSNNPNIQGLEKEEIKAAIKEGETKQKEIKDEIKELDKERKEILSGSDSDKNEKAKEKLESKEEKVKELVEIETNLQDLKTVDKGGWKSKLPNKLSWNNGLWLGGFLIALYLIYKICVGVFRGVFRSIGFEE
ncbi:MAG: hypothetical protein MRERV_18c009 [Mycoplasmataceae bacterium RV_VA103A]|nr:MAG: hypothetical protein MRERV_18c009 [Mycoplasmataceae bacterium RV_VA103A]